MAERLPFGPSTRPEATCTIRLMGEVMVDFDNNRIWGPLLTKAVGSLLPNAAREKLLAEKFEFFEDALDLLFSCTNREKIIKATLKWIRTTTVAGYHGSRLIDLEVDSIRSLGLLPLEAPARRERLVRALSCHPRWNAEALDAALLEYGEGNKAGHREGQVSLTLSRCGLLHGFNHYLAYGSEFDKHVACALLGDEGTELLREDGKARIIQVAVPGPVALNRANRYFSIADWLERGELPNLVADFLKAWSYTLAHPEFDCGTLQIDCGMGFCEAIPSRWIVNIETLPTI